MVVVRAGEDAAGGARTHRPGARRRRLCRRELPAAVPPDPICVARHHGGGTVAEIPVLVDRLAEPHLPPRLAEQARERAARRTRYAEELDEVDRAAPDADAEDVAIPDLDAGEAAPEEADVA